MKKKLLTLFLAFVLVFSNFIVASAEETIGDPPEMTIPTATGAEALAAVSDTANAVVIDLRSTVDYEAAHLKGTISLPVCLSASENYQVTTTLKNAFIDYVNANPATFEKDIYLVCYVGTFCVNHAANWLINDCGISADKLFRVEGGVWNDADLAANLLFTTADYALDAVNNGNGLILDVRATEVYYNDGYLDKSLHQPLFNRVDGSNVVTNRNDELSDKFNAFVAANKETLKNNNIYILCNGGASGAAAATALLSNADIKGNVFTIEGGANALKVAHPELFVKQQFVSSQDAIDAIGSTEIVTIDVRTKENFDKGHLKGALSYPVFGASGVTSGADQLAKDFLTKVGANAATFTGKDIYIVCNSGASGAKAATKLLMQAGYSNANIHTIEGGAKGLAGNLTYVSADQALSVIGNDDYVIIDVRAAVRNEAGYLEGSISLPLFTVDANDKNVPVADPYEDNLSQAFLDYVNNNREALAGKTIYILCNSGATGAKNATILLEKSDIVENVYTIEGGATNKSIQDAFVTDNDSESGDDNTTTPDKDEQDSTTNNNTTTDKTDSPQTGDTAPIMNYVLIMLAAAVAIAAIISKKRFAK